MTFPCNYELLKDGFILIPKMYQSELNNINKLSIPKILLISWTNIKSLKINNLETRENMFFTNISEILNKNESNKFLTST